MTTRSARVDRWRPLLAAGAAASRAGAAQVEVQPRPGRPARGRARGREALHELRLAGAASSKPILYPIRTARGTIVTRGFPLDPRPGERVDHPHQVGLLVHLRRRGRRRLLGQLRGDPARGAREDGHRSATREVVAARGGAGRGELEVRARLGDARTARSALEETTRFVLPRGRRRRAIDRVTTLAAKRQGDVPRHQGGDARASAWRARSSSPPTSPRSSPTRAASPPRCPCWTTPASTGLYTSSEGLKGDAVWGTRARWMALVGAASATRTSCCCCSTTRRTPATPPTGTPAATASSPRTRSARRSSRTARRRSDRTRSRRASAPSSATGWLILPGPFSAEKAEAAWKAFAAEYGK